MHEHEIFMVVCLIAYSLAVPSGIAVYLNEVDQKEGHCYFSKSLTYCNNNKKKTSAIRKTVYYTLIKNHFLVLTLSSPSLEMNMA